MGAYNLDIMHTLLKSALDWSTPLGMASAVVLVLSVILKKIIAKSVPRALTKAQSTVVLLAIIRSLTIVAAIGLVLGVVGYVVGLPRDIGASQSQRPITSDIKGDVTINGPRQGSSYETHGDQSPIIPDNKGNVTINGPQQAPAINRERSQ